jgi:hypothetical protein
MLPISTRHDPPHNIALFCFTLSFRDAEDLLVEPGIEVS